MAPRTVEGDGAQAMGIGGDAPGLLRPKRNLSTVDAIALAVLAITPIVMTLVRIAALPGAVGTEPMGPIGSAITAVGVFLNDVISLDSTPPGDRQRVLFLLFLPTSAILIALTRITLGIRVLGFRSILIAVGFQQSGIVPSLVLIVVVALTIVTVRPTLRRIRLPKYARLSVILCIVAAMMIVALLAGPFVGSYDLWSTAFFPVIVLGLLAEGFAQTLDRENVFAATWRISTTIVLALLITLLFHFDPLREMLLRFPELIVTQIVCIFLISEFLDYRLLGDVDAWFSGIAPGKIFSSPEAMRVAVIRNRSTSGVIQWLGRLAPSRVGSGSVQQIVDALRDRGHTVRVFEGDASLLAELGRFIPPHGVTGEPGGIALNLAEGLQGEARQSHVPAMLEMSGVPYTGPTPHGHAVGGDRFLAKTVLRRAGVPTPDFALMTRADDAIADLRFPLVVKPRRELVYRLRVVTDRAELEAAVDELRRRFGEQALVEEYVDGPEVIVALLGNDPPQCLPLVEIEPERRDRICPARLDEATAEAIRDRALAAFTAFECRDYARVSVRVGASGPVVTDVNSVAILHGNGSFVRAAEEAGYSRSELMCRIVEVARQRYAAPERLRSVRSFESGPSELRLVFVGDTSFGESNTDPRREKKVRTILTERGYDSCLESFAPLVRDADLVVANFEGALVTPGRSPYDGVKKVLYRGDPVDAPDALKRHNVGLVSLANNHAFDYGQHALRLTLDLLEEHSIAVVGAGMNAASAGRAWSRSFRLGDTTLDVSIFAGLQQRKRYEEEYRYYATRKRAGVNLLDVERLARRIRQVKLRAPQRLVIVYPHWGRGYAQRNAAQVEIAHALVEAGADLVLGHGSHVAQEIELYQGRWIVYGLGNFVFNSPGHYADRGVPALGAIARLTVTATEDEALDERLRLYPIFTDNRVIDYHPRFADEDELETFWGLIGASDPGELRERARRGADQFGVYVELTLARTGKRVSSGALNP